MHWLRCIGWQWTTFPLPSRFGHGQIHFSSQKGTSRQWQKDCYDHCLWWRMGLQASRKRFRLWKGHSWISLQGQYHHLIQISYSLVIQIRNIKFRLFTLLTAQSTPLLSDQTNSTTKTKISSARNLPRLRPTTTRYKSTYDRIENNFKLLGLHWKLWYRHEQGW